MIDWTCDESVYNQGRASRMRSGEQVRRSVYNEIGECLVRPSRMRSDSVWDTLDRLDDNEIRQCVRSRLGTA